MLKALLLATAIAVVTTPTFADEFHHRRPEHRPAPIYRHNGNNGFLFGLGAAAIIGSIFYFEGRRCWNELVGYDQWGREIVQRRCEY